jgi:hypothetical protein
MKFVQPSTGLPSVTFISSLNSPYEQYFSYIVAVNFNNGGSRGTRIKTTDLPQITDKRYFRSQH